MKLPIIDSCQCPTCGNMYTRVLPEEAKEIRMQWAYKNAMRVPIQVWHDAVCNDWMVQPIEWPDDNSDMCPGLFADDYRWAIIGIRREIAEFLYYGKANR